MEIGTNVGPYPHTDEEVPSTNSVAVRWLVHCPGCKFSATYAHQGRAILHQKQGACPNCDRMMAVTRIDIPAKYASLMNGELGNEFISGIDPVGIFRPNIEVSENDLDRFFDSLVRVGYLVDERNGGQFADRSYRILLGRTFPGGPI